MDFVIGVFAIIGVVLLLKLGREKYKERKGSKASKGSDTTHVK